MDRTVEAIVEFTSQFRFEDLSPSAVLAAKKRIIDSVGCALGGYLSPPAHVARRLAYPVHGNAGARVWGSLIRTTPDLAAFANGIAVRYLDFNDTYRSLGGGHPSDNMSALIAIAEERGASGRSLIEGVAACYEVHLRIADTIPLADNRLDQPTNGVMGAAMGAGKVMGLSRDQLRHALSLAIVPNVALFQTRTGELSWWKGCAGPMGARQGLFAAQLAGAGMQGPHHPLEGENGLFAHLGTSYQLKPLGVGPRWGIEQSNIKTWPVRDSCQLAINAARLLREQVRATEIESLQVQTYESTYRFAVQEKALWAPQTRETADHSMPFCLAVTLLDGEVTPETFLRRRFLDEDVLNLIRKMHIEVNPDFTAQIPAVRNCLIEASLKSGDRRHVHYMYTKEEIERGLPDELITEKFVRLSRDVLLEEQRTALLDELWNLERVEDTARLVDRLHL